jgi:hypothetical protein
VKWGNEMEFLQWLWADRLAIGMVMLGSIVAAGVVIWMAHPDNE